MLVFQQFCHAIDAAGIAERLHLDGDPPRAVATFVLPENVGDDGHEFAISLFSGGLCFRQPGVITSAARFEHLAHRRQRKDSFEGELFDEGVGIG